MICVPQKGIEQSKKILKPGKQTLCAIKLTYTTLDKGYLKNVL
jgi:hypothetical protein